MSADQSLGSGGIKHLPPQPFANYALDYHDFGLAIVPCEGKVPKSSWKRYQVKRPSTATIYRWMRLFPAANIGLITGIISATTVIDCDDPNLSLEELEAEFGESKFAVLTPSGGKHLYYKFNGEASQIGFKDKIDVKAEGGLVIAPNSFGSKKNASYQIIKGNLSDLNNLVSLKICLKRVIKRENKIVFNSADFGNSEPKISEGQRNNHLFYQLKEIANKHSNYQSLEDAAFEINAFL
jgi:hypothetical protein